MLHNTRRNSELSVTSKQRFPPLCTRLLFIVNTLTVLLSFCNIESELFAVLIKILFDNWRRFCCPSVIYVSVKCPRGGGIWSPEWTLVWGIWTLFGPGRGELEQQFSKKSNARGVVRGGMLKLRFDRYITRLWSAACRRDDHRLFFFPKFSLTSILFLSKLLYPLSNFVYICKHEVPVVYIMYLSFRIWPLVFFALSLLLRLRSKNLPM